MITSGIVRPIVHPVVRKVTGSTGGASFSPGSLDNLTLWLRADSDSVATSGSRQFTAANSERLTRSDNAELSLAGSSFAISFWLYPDNVSGTQVFAAKDNLSSREWFIFRSNANVDVFVFDSVSGSITVSKSAALTAGQWSHIIAQLDVDGDKKVTVYCDNDAGTTSSSALSNTTNDSTAAFEIGARNASLYFDGRVSRFGFWKRTLTADERTFLYNSGSGQTYGGIGVGGTDGSDLKTDLVSYWNLSEASGDATDAHGSNDLTDNNTVTAAAGPGDAFDVSDGDPVSTWRSREGSNYDFSQATTAKRPTWVESAINSKPALDFDGTDDLLVHATDILSGTSGTVCIVFQQDTTGAGDYALSASDEATANKHVAIGQQSGEYGITQNNGGTADTVDGDTAASTSAALLIVQSSGTAYTIRLNGAAETVSADSGTDSGDWFGDTTDKDNAAIGALKASSESGHFNGKIAELAVYGDVLSADEIADWEAYASSRYGITLP